MQLVQPSKFFCVTIFRTRSIGSWHPRMHANLGYVAIFSNTENFRCLYSHYGSCMPSSPKEHKPLLVLYSIISGLIFPLISLRMEIVVILCVFHMQVLAPCVVQTKSGVCKLTLLACECVI